MSAETQNGSVHNDGALSVCGFCIGDEVRVEGEREVFRIVSINADGSITCTSSIFKHFRSFRPEWCWLAWRRGRGAIKKRNPMPAGVKGLRDEWRRSKGLERAAPMTGRNSENDDARDDG